MIQGTKKTNNFTTTENKEILSFKEDIEKTRSEFSNIIKNAKIIDDMRYLRKIAIYIKQIQYNAKRLSLHPKIRKKAKAIQRFLETPLVPPFTHKMSLAEAAIAFSEQDPQESDLREILHEISGLGDKAEFLHLFQFSRYKERADSQVTPKDVA